MTDPYPTLEESAPAVAKAVAARRARHRADPLHAGLTTAAIAERVTGITLPPRGGRDGWWLVGRVLDELVDAEFSVWYMPGPRRIGLSQRDRPVTSTPAPPSTDPITTTDYGANGSTRLTGAAIADPNAPGSNGPGMNPARGRRRRNQQRASSPTPRRPPRTQGTRERSTPSPSRTCPASRPGSCLRAIGYQLSARESARRSSDVSPTVGVRQSILATHDPVHHTHPRLLDSRLPVRVIAGDRRGFQLKGPAGKFTRPMADRVRGALFSMLASLGVEPERVLDLYAGTGGIGIEALSRGAESADFVEQNAAAAAVVRANLAHTRYTDVTRVHQEPVSTFLARAERNRRKSQPTT